MIYLQLVAVLAPAVYAAFPDCANGPLRNNTVCDPTAGVGRRARALLDALTLEEKFSLTGSTSPAVDRLGLPAYTWWNEALHGIAKSPGVNFSLQGDFSYATSFPQPILMGAAFDDDLIEAVASVVSTEARAFNNFGRAGLDFWTPNINPFRDNRWGRGQETPGEDPFHLSSYVKRLILGLQGGSDPSSTKKVVATCKHWVAYDMEDWHGNFRYQFDADVSSQDLSEYYSPSFQACARDSDVGSFMCSYNAVNGVPTCASPYILQDILREHWNWTSEDHYITSDCDAVQNVFLPHRYASDPAQAVADTLNAGTDLDCGSYYPLHLPEALSRGLVNESTIDQSLARLFAAQIRLGYFDSARSESPYRELSFADVNTPNAQTLALKAAEEGIVLLKNDGTLPITRSPNGTRLALIGSWANATTELQGNYAGVAPYLRSPLYAARKLGFNVSYASGVGGQGDPTTDSWLSSLDAAREADIVVIADGINNDVESEGMDRETVAWTGAQVDFINEAAKLGRPLIILQMGGGQLDDSPFLENPNVSAIVWGGYPGQDGGTALLNILTGNTNPAGRLPTTQYPAAYVNQVPMTDMTLRPNASTGNPGRTYRWYNGSVLHFGYGLHYTDFNVSMEEPWEASNHTKSDPQIDLNGLTRNCQDGTFLDQCPFVTVPVHVSNTGKVRASDYVALGFLRGAHGPEPYPIKTLVAYQRLFNIQPGGQQTALLNLTLGSLARADGAGNKLVYPGGYCLGVDTDAEGEPLAEMCWKLSGDPLTVEKWPQPR